MKSLMPLMVGALAVTALIPLTASGQDARNQGYLLDQNAGIVTSFTTGLCWRDSDWTPARAVERCDPVDRPLAYAPATAPSPEPAAKPTVIAVVVAAPQPASAQPTPQKMSFSADALFAFDNAQLQPEGRAMLDDFVRQLGGATYDTISATGHADRFGSDDYNQKLSLRRANAVKDYLMSKDILASRIEAEGKGKSQPVSKAGECAGVMSAKVIACLQPDRRVDIELTGTKTTVVAQ
jgi:OmpA-OmpF porin, OOP family